MATVLNTLSTTASPDQSGYSMSTRTLRDSFCYECATRIFRGQNSYSYVGNEAVDEPFNIILCPQCECDWRILTRVEGQHAHPCLVQFGTLRVRVIAAHRQGFLICAEGASLTVRWVPTPKPPREIEQPIAIEPALSKDYTKATLAQVMAEFENDMTYDPKTRYDRQRFRHSLARQELCRRPGALQEIACYLRGQPPGNTPFVRTGWGNLLCFLQIRVDPESAVAPDDYDAIDGWIEWVEKFLASRS